MLGTHNIPSSDFDLLQARHQLRREARLQICRSPEGTAVFYPWVFAGQGYVVNDVASFAVQFDKWSRWLAAVAALPAVLSPVCSQLPILPIHSWRVLPLAMYLGFLALVLGGLLVRGLAYTRLARALPDHPMQVNLTRILLLRAHSQPLSATLWPALALLALLEAMRWLLCLLDLPPAQIWSCIACFFWPAAAFVGFKLWLHRWVRLHPQATQLPYPPEAFFVAVAAFECLLCAWLAV